MGPYNEKTYFESGKSYTEEEVADIMYARGSHRPGFLACNTAVKNYAVQVVGALRSPNIIYHDENGEED